MNCHFNDHADQSTGSQSLCSGFLIFNRFINIGPYKGENKEEYEMSNVKEVQNGEEIVVKPVAGRIGAEISGIQLSRNLDPKFYNH